MPYLLFAGNAYYPSGGAEDLIGKFNSINEAEAAFNPSNYTLGWANILDLDTLEIVKQIQSEEY